MATVTKASVYRHSSMGSLGDARYMLLQQHKFPYKYEECPDLKANPPFEDYDFFTSVDSDRCFSWDYKHTEKAFKKIKVNCGFEYWARSAKPAKIFSFLQDIIQVRKNYPGVKWTGFRILGTVNQSNGYPVWTLQLFAKGKNTDTIVYSDQCAPNVDYSTMCYQKMLDGTLVRMDGKVIEAHEY